MKNKIYANLLVCLSTYSISSHLIASNHVPPVEVISLDNKLPSNLVKDKPCSKENLIYLNKTVVNKKVIELCYWENGVYRYKYGKVGNPEIILYSKNVTKEDVPLGGFSFIHKQYEYSVIEDNYKPTLAIYKDENVLTQIFLTKQVPGYVNKTLTSLPEKVY